VRRVIILWASGFASLLPLAFSSDAAAASAADTYKAKCALCHDSGATGAPRVGLPADWRQRADKGYAGLLRSAMQGVHAAATPPEDDVAAALRYMLSTVNLAADLPAASAPRSAALQVDDSTLALAVADALLNAKIGGVQILARGGRITLTGKVENAAAAARALKAAQSTPGVRDVENRLVSPETSGRN
jgi:hypothetical protein